MVCGFFFFFFFFFKQKTAYEIMPSLVGSEMCIRDRYFILVYNWIRKLFLVETQNDPQEVDVEVMQLMVKVLECLIIAQLLPGDLEVVEFSVKKYKQISTSNDKQEILKYIKEKLKHLEYFRLSFYGKGIKLQPIIEEE
eukprot:TRINITY_DN2882_c0_g1_i1.p1 TRINITY_DN2882_c0_g1~~TRINITY_DN2882_c0_g1_i1.p1  ORF type:complete len:139 (+),score=39.77 TRINITY_DN2882_c0_g1_i1:26-442(+)